MEETSRLVLEVLRSDDRVAWVVDQLMTSFSEGIAHSAKEQGSNVQRDFLEAANALTLRERTRREKYETSRPYDEQEKLELVRFALRAVFVTLPLMQTATAKALEELGSTATHIEFDAPDEEERPDGSYVQTVLPDPKALEVLRRRVEEFNEKLVP